MERAIVTVLDHLLGSDTAVDLDVPADLPAERLVDLLQGMFSATGRPPGRRLVTRVVLRLVRPDEPARELRPNQSLADVDAWDGSILELAGVRDEIAGRREGPVIDWKPLLDRLGEGGDEGTIVFDQPAPPRQNNSGYVRHRVD